eukprot:2300713-Karenia_brevis.AAC.1
MLWSLCPAAIAQLDQSTRSRLLWAIMPLPSCSKADWLSEPSCSAGHHTSEPSSSVPSRTNFSQTTSAQVTSKFPRRFLEDIQLSL